MTINEIYLKFCMMIDYDEIEHPYLSEDTNYMLAFDKYVKECTNEELLELVPNFDFDKAEEFEQQVSDFVYLYFLNNSRCKPISFWGVSR